MLTGNTIRVLTHGHIDESSPIDTWLPVLILSLFCSWQLQSPSACDLFHEVSWAISPRPHAL